MKTKKFLYNVECICDDKVGRVTVKGLKQLLRAVEYFESEPNFIKLEVNRVKT